MHGETTQIKYEEFISFWPFSVIYASNY